MTAPLAAAELRNRRRAFLLLWGGQIFSLTGSSAASFTLGLAAYQETGSVTALAMITGVSTFGSIYFAPLCGAIADHFNRRSAMLFGNVALAFTSLLLALVAFAGVGTHLALALALVFLAALLGAGLSVTLSATVRELRTEADLTRINGFLSLLASGPTIAGPVLGAAIYVVTSAGVVFLVEAGTFLLCALVITATRWQGRPSGRITALRPFAGAAAGLRYVLSDRDFRFLQLSFAGINFLNGLAVAAATAFVVAASVAGMAEWNLALASVAGAVGLLLGSLAVVALAGRVPRHLMISGGVLVGAAVGRIGLALGMMPMLWAAAFGLRNAAIQVSNAPLTAIWQERVPLEIQATVFGARRLLGQGFYPLAVVLGGLLGDHVLSTPAVLDMMTRTGLDLPAPAAGVAALLILAGFGELILGSALLRSKRVRTLAAVTDRHAPASDTGGTGAEVTTPAARRG